MKKFFKSRIFSFILGAIIFSGITSVAAYSLFAESVGYTPAHTSWKKSNGEDITNVKEALDELFLKYHNDNKNIDLRLFKNNKMDATYMVVPTEYDSYDGVWYHSTSSITYNFSSNSDFEIAVDLIFENGSNGYMGGPQIYFYNNDEEVGIISIHDGWGAEIKTVSYVSMNNKELYNTTTRNTNYSGKYSIVRDGNTLYLYCNSSLLNSIDFNEEVKFNRVEIDFAKYPSYPVPNTYIKNIYIGDIINH